MIYIYIWYMIYIYILVGGLDHDFLWLSIDGFTMVYPRRFFVITNRIGFPKFGDT